MLSRDYVTMSAWCIDGDMAVRSGCAGSLGSDNNVPIFDDGYSGNDGAVR